MPDMEDHLKEGEISELYKYLITQQSYFSCLDSLIATAGKVLDIVYIKILEEQREKRDRALSYRSRSTYGTNPADIMGNSAAHFKSCEPCMKQYAGVVEEAANFARPKEGLFIPPIRQLDFLGILPPR